MYGIVCENFGSGVGAGVDRYILLKCLVAVMYELNCKLEVKLVKGVSVNMSNMKLIWKLIKV